MIEFHDLALDELRVARQWYRSRSEQAAEHFVQRLDEAIERLMVDPASQARVGRSFYYVPIRRFPFQVIYEVRTSDTVRIVAIARVRRRSGYWRRRR